MYLHRLPAREQGPCLWHCAGVLTFRPRWLGPTPIPITNGVAVLEVQRCSKTNWLVHPTPLTPLNTINKYDSRLAASLQPEFSNMYVCTMSAAGCGYDGHGSNKSVEFSLVRPISPSIL